MSQKNPYNFDQVAQEGQAHESKENILAIDDQLAEEDAILQDANDLQRNRTGVPPNNNSSIDIDEHLRPTFKSRKEIMLDNAQSPRSINHKPESDQVVFTDPDLQYIGNRQSKQNLLQSRRLKTYDEDDSQDSEVENFSQNDIFSKMQQRIGAQVNAIENTGEALSNKPNPKFNNFSDVFQNLVKEQSVMSKWPIVTMMITYDSSRATTVTKKDDEEWYVKQYDLETTKMTFEEKIGGMPKDYIRMKEVEQNSAGNKFAFIYNNDGRWYVRTHGKETRTEEEIQRNELDVNKLLGLDDHTMCTHIFPDPFGNCCFVTDSQLYICVFHNYTKAHYHFVYDMDSKQMIGKVTKVEMDCSKKNFPYKSFYNDDINEIYTFYRQGQSLIINSKDTSEYKLDRMTEMDLGEMYLVYNKALMARSSSQVLCFKIEQDKDTKERKFVQYDKIPIIGFVYYIKGNVRIQVVEESKIYFYAVDKETLEVTLENAMANYMKCQQMMFGSKVKYGITYKANQKAFSIYRRKFQHDFMVTVNNKNLEGSVGLDYPTMGTYLVSQVDKILMYDNENYKFFGEVPIQLLKADTREPNQIIAMKKDQNEQYLAIITGKKLIMNEVKTNQLFIFKRKQIDAGSREEFELQKKVVLKDIPIFSQVSMDFHFRENGQLYKNSLIFAKIDCIFELNFDTEQVSIVYKFTTRPLRRQPEFFKPNNQQSIFMVSSPEDCIYINISNQYELDIDQQFTIDSIKGMIFDPQEEFFYLLCNKYDEKLGFFVIKIDQLQPNKGRFLIKWKNKSDIGDTYMTILEDKNSGIRELIISYKVIFINIYRIQSMDISINEDSLMLFRHESFQLWESECQGLLLKKNKDFVRINKSGMHVLSLRSQEKFAIKDDQNMDWMCHSLEAFNFLKIESDNFLSIDGSKKNEVIVKIEQELDIVDKNEGNESRFFDVYKLKISQPTLRELLVLNSLYLCKTMTDIIDIVDDQPKPLVFYKSFLELNGSNMTSILSFDSRSMEFLLGDDFNEYFDPDFPMFYKNKFYKGKHKKKLFYRSAIDNALKNNQIGSVAKIINYIVNHQNNKISSWLFTKNMPDMIEKGVSIIPLLESKVFVQEFDYDQWPGTHCNDEEVMLPYSGSVFKLQNEYSKIFSSDDFAPMADEDDEASNAKGHQQEKVYKIEYSVNMLPMLGMYVERIRDPITLKETKEIKNGDVNFLGICTEIDGDEMDMFDTQSMKDLIEFKWPKQGFKIHFVAFLIHACYMIYLFYYTQIVYINVRPGTMLANEDQLKYNMILLVFVAYPLMYESIQAVNGGVGDYLSDPGNYIDMTYIFGSAAMSIVHLTTSPYTWYSRLLMVVVCILAIRRTFNILKIFENFSPIITMISQVLTGLIPFSTVFMILIVLFSLNLGVIGWNDPKNPKFMQTFAPDYPGVYISKALTPQQFLGFGEFYGGGGEMPDFEYAYLRKFMGNFFTMLRLSMGDFDIEPTAVLQNDYIQCIYLGFWLISLFISNIIFLNFIVAEASAFYEKVAEKLEVYIQQNRASLISESESLQPECFIKIFENWYPKYIIQRKIGE